MSLGGGKVNADLLASWLRWYDPVHRGWTPLGIANGICMTNGFSFPRIRGGYNLYRAIEHIPSRGAEPAGAAGSTASRLRTFPWIRHNNDTHYQYRLVPVGGGGVENWTDETVVSFMTDEEGDWKGSVPNAPTDLQVVPLSQGRFRVRWTYCPQGEEVEPSGFRLYTTHEGVLDYGSIAASVPFASGRIHFEHITPSYEDGERVGWAVRASSAAGHEERNMHQVYAFARSQPPPMNPVVMISVHG